MPAVAMTDHGNLFGAIDFYQKAKNHGIKPIIGCEAYMAPGSRSQKSGHLAHNEYYHLILLATNQVGYIACEGGGERILKALKISLKKILVRTFGEVKWCW